MDSNPVPAKKPGKALLKILPVIIILALIAAIVVFKTYVIVEPGHRGIVVQLGAVKPTVWTKDSTLWFPLFSRSFPLKCGCRKSNLKNHFF
jgi:energy-coupling factor transporter transmembrane protein EcfT